MRVFPVLRVVAFAAVLATPAVQASFADEQQSPTGDALSSSASVPQSTGGPYSNDFVMSPPVGN